MDRIARMLGHPIGVRSQLDKGSVFFIEVPIGVLPHSLPPRQPAPPMPQHMLADAVAVVIDDQDSILEGMRELLQGWGCSVLAAIDGRTAVLELARGEYTPDIVIADYHPDGGSTGVAAVEEVRHCYDKTIPGVIITADRSPEIALTVRRHGCHLLRKPLKPAKLRALVSHLLGHRASRTDQPLRCSPAA